MNPLATFSTHSTRTGLRAVAAVLALTLAGGAMAQGFPGHGHDDHRRGGDHGQRHDRFDHRDVRHGMPRPRAEWHRGGYIPAAYRGPQYVVTDWRARHLQAPPVGYQWMQVNGDFVLGAIAGGLIAAIVAGQ